MKGQFMTDQGLVRSHNEDAGGVFYNKHDQLLAVIADGMGGHQAGDVASRMATSLMETEWLESEQLDNPEAAESWLQTAVEKINKKVYEHSLTKEECQGMGTTFVVAICTEDFITVSNIGDSRCYMLSEDGFKQITVDHSLVNELVRSGQISKDDAEQHPRKNVLLKALGTEKSVVPEIISLDWEMGNRLLLCSDGLSNKVTDEELHRYILADEDIEQIETEMIRLANNRGGEDNISVIVVMYDSPEKDGER
ncbi:serine/threonine phosphatase stp [Oceanobacillus picturae]|uniref:protein-serine/threonine phosphatase n=1 Tax=Oceanobacillus picturae TaxID=171693 RepID=A0A0U9H559_9BACI|nr:Stp1/IreP family PP2C-type Ser/Thr phosphatase [Oceanobacillus picturae]RIU96416.1 Stp1/IreP family PP2C-type Ser/Thr phosphatase [Oceanobacillus picturae]GAQ17834.1 serine/threonine phosphatase stp [Oceanobacillus picturae]